MSSLIKICTLLIVSFAVVNFSTANSANRDERQTIVVVKDMETLRLLIRELSGLQGMNANYDGEFNREIVEKTLEQVVNYQVPQNSYALIVKTRDVQSSQAIMNILQKYTSLQNVNVEIGTGRRRKRISGLISAGAAMVSAVTALTASVRDTISRDTLPTDPYGKIVMDAAIFGLSVFSAGMAAVSLVPNPVTSPVSAGAGALSLGLLIARDAIYK